MLEKKFLIEDNKRNKLEKFCENQAAGSVSWSSQNLVFTRHCKYYVKRMYYPVSYEITDEDIIIIRELQEIMRKNGMEASFIQRDEPDQIIYDKLEKLVEDM